VLSNLYLHFVLDSWFEKKIKPQCRGEAYLLRLCLPRPCRWMVGTNDRYTHLIILSIILSRRHLQPINHRRPGGGRLVTDKQVRRPFALARRNGTRR
jgi:hypothetical protein